MNVKHSLQLAMRASAMHDHHKSSVKAQFVSYLSADIVTVGDMIRHDMIGDMRLSLSKHCRTAITKRLRD